MKEQTGFADVDGSGRTGALVDYLALVADRVGDFRRAGYDMLRLEPGTRVLDVGCGAGEVCVELAARVGPRGRVTGIDLSEAMIEAARRAVATAPMVVELQVADIYALPFADSAFDAVRCERVFQHLAHPEAALRELCRVTRPGGRVMVIDPDHGQTGLALDEPAHQRVYDAFQRAMMHMTINPHSGTRLPGMFVRAGLIDVTQMVRALEFDQPAFMQMFFVHERLAKAVATGDITTEEAGQFVDALAARHHAGIFYCNVVGYNVAGTKP